MPVKDPWYSIKGEVHHLHSLCEEGKHIPRDDRREGTDGKPLCRECKRLIAEGK